MSAQLPDEDLTSLIASAASPEAAALRLGQNVAASSLSEAERLVAGRLLNLLLDQVALRVREIIAETVKASPLLPHEVASRLLHDLDSVAIPVIRYSTVLTDEDLLEVVHSDQPARQIAVAGRRSLGEAVIEALVDTDNSEAVACLIGNPTVTLGSGALERIAIRFSDEEAVVALLKNHPALSAHLAERLRRYSTAALTNYLEQHPELPDDIVVNLVLRTREGVRADPSPDRSVGRDAVELATRLGELNRLSPALFVRTLCAGDLELLEAAFSTKAGIPLSNTTRVLHEGGVLGLASIVSLADLPKSLVPVLGIGLDVLHGLYLEGHPFDRELFERTVLERLLTQPVTFDAEDLDYLLIRLRH